MAYCPNGHGEFDARFCPECGARLTATPPTQPAGDSVRVRSPEAHANVQQTFIMPGQAATWVWGVVAVLVVIVAALVIYLATREQKVVDKVVKETVVVTEGASNVVKETVIVEKQVPQVVKETVIVPATLQVVEKEVTKIVKETVAVEMVVTAGNAAIMTPVLTPTAPTRTDTAKPSPTATPMPTVTLVPTPVATDTPTPTPRTYFDVPSLQSPGDGEWLKSAKVTFEWVFDHDLRPSE